MFKRIFNFCKLTVKASPLFFVFNLVMLTVFSLAMLGMSYSFKFATDVIMSAANTGEFGVKIALPILLFFLMICIGGNTYNFNQMIITLYTNKAKKLFYKYFIIKSYKEKQDSFYDSNFYDNYAFTKKNIENTTGVSVTIFNNLTSAAIQLIVCGFAITTFSPLVLVFILVVAVVSTLINKYVVKRRVALDEAFTNDGRKSNYYSELLTSKQHAKELRVFKLKGKFIKSWSDTYKRYANGKYNFEKKAMVLNQTPQVVQLVFHTALSVYFLYLVSVGKLTVGDFVFLNTVMGNLSYSIMTMSDVLSRELAEKYKYIEKYEAFTGKVDNKQFDKMASYKLSDFALSNGTFDELSLKNITYSYPNQEGKAVENVSLKIRKGEVVSLLGYNGSGKSTLSKLMCGILEDYSGSITLNGKDIKTLPSEDIYRYFGIGFQDFTRYSLTLKENIGFGMIEKADDEEQINLAIEKGNLQEVIKRLPNGVNSVIGKEFDSNGQELSGGQWQRVILSRAYMGEPEFLILDEPTASIDPIEEMRMLEHFGEIVKGKTALLISHRIGFARLSNRICVMENGKIVEDGTHEALMNLKGHYYELFTSQQELYAKEAV